MADANERNGGLDLMEPRYRKDDDESRTGVGPGDRRRAFTFERYADHLRKRYGTQVRRVPVDAGFPCPHKRPDGSGGCSFCAPAGSRSPQLDAVEGISAQVRRAASFAKRRYGPSQLLLYFQAYTSTNAEPDALKAAIDEGLTADDFRGLVVSTRPDCLDAAKLALLVSYRRPDFDVEMELGLQSSNDATLTRIGRGHTADDFARAVALCRGEKVRTTAHVIFGLPGETDAMMLGTIAFAVAQGVDALKIHDLHIPRGSALAASVLAGEMTTLCHGHHLELCARALELIPRRVVVERFTCETLDSARLLPKRQIDKARFYRDLDEYMERNGMRQGSAAVPTALT